MVLCRGAHGWAGAADQGWSYAAEPMDGRERRTRDGLMPWSPWMGGSGGPGMVLCRGAHGWAGAACRTHTAPHRTTPSSKKGPPNKKGGFCPPFYLAERVGLMAHLLCATLRAPPLRCGVQESIHGFLSTPSGSSSNHPAAKQKGGGFRPPLFTWRRGWDSNPR